MLTRYRHWLALCGIGCILVMDHLPERTPEMLLASLAGEPAVSSDWDDLPIMYE